MVVGGGLRGAAFSLTEAGRMDGEVTNQEGVGILHILWVGWMDGCL